ncbi:MAG: TIGR01777 family protein [Actinobacteria bacterium]|nr:TIGR01777 family protein [Actinomycetota bacterium]MBA3567359.1 TIGR01777 family protein [Actinomycetota bacterium]MDQ3425750.1 TIGR01777 family oxidoreductase [Actinomycetota bacterium]
MRVAVTGASGLIGSALVPVLREAKHEVLSLVRRTPTHADEAQWDPAAGTIDVDALQGVDAIVHLAGENIGQRWTETSRRRILDSRVQGTRLVAETAAALDPQPALLAASAMGFYGQQGDQEFTESSPRGQGFLADVVDAWEQAAEVAREAGVRVVQFRQGLVLSKDGGALGRMLLPFRLGVGGRIGGGRQWWSWVAIDDLAAAYLFALERPLDGLYNLAAPGVVRNADFVDALGNVLSRPTIFPLPGFAVRLAFGEMGEEMLLGGQRIDSERLRGEGFEFAYPELEGALEHVLGS